MRGLLETSCGRNLRRPCRRSRSASGGPPPRCSCASRRPAAQVPPSSTHASGKLGAAAERCGAPRGASSSSSATVSARHSTTSSLPHVPWRRCASASLRSTSTPVSSNRPPLRYSGRPVSASTSGDARRRPTRTARAANRRATATACGTAPSRADRGLVPRARRRVAPDIAERDAAEPLAASARSRRGRRAARAGCVPRATARRAVARVSRSNRAARARLAAEHVGARRPARRPAGAAARRGHRGRPADCPARPGTAAPGVAASSAAQRGGVHAQRLARGRREHAGRERAQARDAEPLGARRSAAPVCGLAIAPRRAGAGVEQHADDREVDRARGAFGRRRGRASAASSSRLPVDAAGLEVAPAAVVRDARASG